MISVLSLLMLAREKVCNYTQDQSKAEWNERERYAWVGIAIFIFGGKRQSSHL